MEHSSIYEIILKTQCDSYCQIMYLLDRISRCDDGLMFEANKEEPSAEKIAGFTNRKNDLVNEVSKITEQICQNQEKLIRAISLTIAATTHPLWERLNILQELVAHKIDQLLLNEDRSNPVLFQSLSQYKERLELDQLIAAVPKENRQVFYFHPGK